MLKVPGRQLGKELEMKVAEADFARRFIRMCQDGWDQGWHERNGGNLSYRMRPEDVEEVREYLREGGEWKPTGVSVPGLAGEFFLVTGSGKYFRNVALDPDDSLCVIELDGTGTNYRILWGLTNGERPTSELPTHLMSHEVKTKISRGMFRVIYHAHPANIIALTFALPLNEETFTRELWEMMPECAVVFPSGIGVVPWMVPGSREIALATSAKMERYDAVIMDCNGMFCSGEDFDSAFGLMHTVEKAAEILVKALSIRPQKLQTPTVENFHALAKQFSLDLPRRFLFDK